MVIDDRIKNIFDFNRILDQDLNHAIDLLNKGEGDVGVNARIFIRAYASWIEGVLWIFKEMIRGIEYQWHRSLPVASQMYLYEYDWEIKNNGMPEIRDKKFSTKANLKAFFFVMHQIFPKYSVNLSENGWKKVQDFYAIRDRMMHPKGIGDLYVSKEDVIKCDEGRHWLMEKFSELFAFLKERIELDESKRTVSTSPLK